MPNRNLVRHHGVLGANGPEGGRLFASVPMTLARDGKLSFVARSVALYVWSHNEKWQQSAAAIAEALGMDRKTVGPALAELQDRGWLIREIHYNPGKTRPSWERWHLQMSNTPFADEEIRELSTPEGVRETDTLAGEVPTKRTRRCPSDGHVGVRETDSIGVHSGVHPEVHPSSGRTDQDETGLESRSLADAGRTGATDGAIEAPEEHRPVGLQPPTANGSHSDDPFATEPAWRAEAAAREERAARHLEPAIAGGSAASPWD